LNAEVPHFRARWPTVVFLGTIAALVVARVLLTLHTPFYALLEPHDETLYVVRAIHLIRGEDMGPYDATVLIKYPGFSLWLAGLQLLGLPFASASWVMYVAAGLYFAAALRACGMTRPLIVLVLFLFLLDPVLGGVNWNRAYREPLATTILTIFLGAALFVGARLAQRAPYRLHLGILAVALGAGLIIREEDRLLWVLYGLVALGILLAVGWRPAVVDRRRVVRIGGFLLTPVVAALLTTNAVRLAVAHWYGAPIVHELSEGEFPLLLGAIRSVDSGRDNRLVMAPQDTLRSLKALVPDFAPVVDLLPAPGPGTLSCRLQGVCSEISNGWMPYFIKDAAWQAGLTPSLIQGQRYFGRIRQQIEEACAAGKLKCRPRGDGFVPSWEWKWTRAYVGQAARLTRMLLLPWPGFDGEHRSGLALPADLLDVYREVLLRTDFETPRPPAAGNLQAVTLGTHSTPALLASWALRLLGCFLLLGSVPALVYLWICLRASDRPSWLLIATGLYAYSALRLAALAYLSVFFGPFESRIVFTTHITLLLFAPLLVLGAWRAYRFGEAGTVSDAGEPGGSA